MTWKQNNKIHKSIKILKDQKKFGFKNQKSKQCWLFFNFWGIVYKKIVSSKIFANAKFYKNVFERLGKRIGTR